MALLDLDPSLRSGRHVFRCEVVRLVPGAWLRGHEYFSRGEGRGFSNSGASDADAIGIYPVHSR